MLDENNKYAIVGRLMQIVTTESVTVQTKNGPVEDEVTADKNSLIAVRSLGGLHLKFLRQHDESTGGVMLSVKDQNSLLDRLIQILARQTVTVHTKNGPVEDEVIADKNSIAAARFMIRLHTKYLKYEEEYADIVRLNEQHQKAIVERLMQILSKQSVIVQAKDGPVKDYVIADKNAITSAILLFKLDTGTATAGSRASGTAGLSASHVGFRIGKSVARRETENGSGTAGLSASHDGLKIGKSFARCETENDSGTSLSHASGEGFEIGGSFARCEPDGEQSDAQVTVQDIIQAAIRMAEEELIAKCDQPGNDDVIERVRGNLHQARV